MGTARFLARLDRDTASFFPQRGIPRSQECTVVGDIALYNAEELTSRLGGGKSAGELLIAAYRRWGPGFAKELLGDFAFALWDHSKKKLLLYRDQIGVKPIYYSLTGSHLMVSNSVESLLTEGGVSPELDQSFITEYLTRFEYDRIRRTFFKNVRKLPASSLLEIDANGVQESEYHKWRSSKEEPLGLEEAAEQTRSLLRDSVLRRIGDAGKIACHLSGGLDSAAIAWVLHESQKPIYYSWSKPLSGPLTNKNDERIRVEALCRRFGSTCRYIPVSTRDMYEVQKRNPATQGQHLLLHELKTLADAAEEEAEVIFSGWGGDEFLSYNGNTVLTEHLLRGNIRAFYRELRARPFRSSLGYLSRLLPHSVQRLTRKSHKPVSFASQELFLELGKEAEFGPPSPLPVTHRQALLHTLEGGYLLERLEAWYAASLERGISYRFPLLDARIVQRSLSLPYHFFRYNGVSRWLFKYCFLPQLPIEMSSENLKHEISVFNVPWSDSVSSEDFELLKDWDCPFVDVERVKFAIAHGQKSRMLHRALVVMAITRHH